MLAQGLLAKTAIDPKEIDYIMGGCVIQEVRTSNIAREAAMAAGEVMELRASVGMYICLVEVCDECMYVCVCPPQIRLA